MTSNRVRQESLKINEISINLKYLNVFLLLLLIYLGLKCIYGYNSKKKTHTEFIYNFAINEKTI